MLKLVTALVLACGLSACVAAALVGTAVEVTGTVVGAAVNTTGAVVDVVVPDGDDKKNAEDEED